MNAVQRCQKLNNLCRSDYGRQKQQPAGGVNPPTRPIIEGLLRYTVKHGTRVLGRRWDEGKESPGCISIHERIASRRAYAVVVDNMFNLDETARGNAQVLTK